MPRKPQFTDEQIVATMKEYPKVADAAGALGISRQALLAYRKKPTIVAALGLPPPTPTESANKEKSRERKATTRETPAINLDMVEEWLLATVKKAGEARRWENKFAIQVGENAALKHTIGKLQERINLLEMHNRKSAEFANMVRLGEVAEPLDR